MCLRHGYPQKTTELTCQTAVRGIGDSSDSIREAFLDIRPASFENRKRVVTKWGLLGISCLGLVEQSDSIGW